MIPPKLGHFELLLYADNTILVLIKLTKFATFLNIVKYYKNVRCGCGAVALIFFNLLKTRTVQAVPAETQCLSLDLTIFFDI